MVMRPSPPSRAPGQTSLARANPISDQLRANSLLPTAFTALFGVFLGLSLLKFGNPPIMEKWVDEPHGFYQFLVATPWPISWAYCLLALISLLGLLDFRAKPTAPWWLIILPSVWFGWQLIAATQSVDAELTRATLKHFAACLLCFYLGFFCLSRAERLWPFWLGL